MLHKGINSLYFGDESKKTIQSSLAVNKKVITFIYLKFG